MTTNLVLPFPLRPGYNAQIVVPINMTKEEADRLCAFVMSLVNPITQATPAQTIKDADGLYTGAIT